MHIHISDHIRGRVDIVPCCCYVATEFVCAWFLPVLPRRSLLFFADPDDVDGEAAIPIPLSFKSLLFAYAKPFFGFWAVIASAFPFVMDFGSMVKPDHQPGFLLFASAFLGAPCLALVVMRWTSVASPRRRACLAEVEGLPPVLASELRKNSDASLDVLGS